MAVLSANGVYLTSVTFLETTTGQGDQNPFYFWMFLLHVTLGLLLIVPFVTFGSLHMRTALRVITGCCFMRWQGC